MADVESIRGLVQRLIGARIDFVVVGGMAAVLRGVPIMTADLDIVHSRSLDNVDRLLALLADLDAQLRFDLANRKLRPGRAHLSGHGHVNLMTSLGPLDLLCEVGDGLGYEDLLADSEWMGEDDMRIRVVSLPRLIQLKTAAGRAKDRFVLPMLIAAADGSGDESNGQE